MAQPQQNLIYLPPGVMPPSQQMQAPVASGIPFDRPFFEQMLPQAIAVFSAQMPCDHPIVELLTVDGTTHYVNGVSGIADAWVALLTQQKDHEGLVQVFVPYQTIFRVEVHPCSDESPRRLGFELNPATPPIVMEAPKPQPEPNTEPTSAELTKPRKRSK